jgi:hypothetical protein
MGVKLGCYIAIKKKEEVWKTFVMKMALSATGCEWGLD